MAHNITGASLDGIYTRLNETQEYHPLDAQTFSDWSMEAGDVVRFERDDDTYESPVHNTKLVWRGAPQMTVSSNGSNGRDAVSIVSRDKYRRGGAAVRSQEHIYRDFHSEDGYLHSYIEMTESYLRTEFSDDMNSLRGEFEVTASHLRADFEDDINSLRGEFEVTASHLRTEFEDDVNSLRSEFEITASHLRTEFEDDVNSLRSEFEVTASHLRSDFEDDINSLRGEFEVTASHLRSDFEDDINSLRGDFEVTASHLRSDFEDDINSLRGEFEVTASHLRSDFEDDINSLRGEFEVTASHLRSDFEDDINSLRGDFEVTASHLRSDFEDDINSLHSELEVTASELRSEYTDEINSVSSRITQQANKIALVVDGDGNIKAAEIAASINQQTGQSAVTLSADIIDIDGIVQRLSTRNITVDDLSVQGQSDFIGETFHTNITCEQTVDTGSLIIDGHDVQVYNITKSDDGNTLTIYYTDGTSTTFSKAASINSLTGSWSGSASSGMTMTVVTNPSTGKEYTISFSSQTANQKLSVDVDRTRDPEQITGTTNIRVPIHVYTPGTGQYDPAVDRWTGTAALNVSSLLEDKTGTNKITANGTYSPSTGYIGFSAVEVNVPSSTITPVLTSGWNGTTFTVSSTPQSTGDKGTTISSKHSYDSSIGVHYIDIDSQDTGAQQPTTRAKYTLGLSTGSVSSGSRTIKVQYNNADTGLQYVCTDYTAGQNSVTVTGPTWSSTGSSVGQSNSVSVSKDGVVQDTKYTYMYLNSSAKKAYIRYGNSGADAVSGTNTTMIGSLDVSSIYTAGQNSVTVAGPTWSSTGSGVGQSNSVSVSRNGVVQDTKYTYMYVDTSAKKAYIRYGNSGADAVSGNNTTMIGVVDASSIHTAGQNSVNVVRGAWTASYDSSVTPHTTYSPSAGTGTSKDLYITMGTVSDATFGTSPSGKIRIYARDDSPTATRTTIYERPYSIYSDGWSGNTNTVHFGIGTGSNHGTLEVDGTPRYTAGQDSVHITSSWNADNNRLSVSKTTSGSTNSMSFSISATPTIVYSSSTHKYTATAQAKVDGTIRGDASSTTSGLEAYYAGKQSVGISDPTADTRTTLNTTRTFTVSTTGRTNASGTTDNLSSTVPLHLYASGWTGNTNTVYLKWGNTAGSSGTNYAQITVDASSIYTTGYNKGNSDVTLNDAAWTYNGDNVDANNRTSNTVTVSTAGRSSQLSKTATVYLDTSASWISNKKIIYVKKNNSSGEHIAIGSVDASSIYTTGYNAGNSDVTLNDAAWTYDGDNVDANNRTSNTVTVSTAGRSSQLSKTATVYLDTSSSWSGNKKSIYVRKNNSSGEHIAIGSVDASSIYEAGWKAGWQAYYDDSIDWYPSSSHPTWSGKAWVPKRNASLFWPSGKGDGSTNTCEEWSAVSTGGGGGGGGTADYTLSFIDTGRVPYNEISTILKGYDYKYITGVKDSAYQQYRYIRFKVGGKMKAFYFS